MSDSKGHVKREKSSLRWAPIGPRKDNKRSNKAHKDNRLKHNKMFKFLNT